MTTVTVPAPSSWKPVSLATPQGGASIAYVDIRAEGADVGVDDLALSALPQPDTAVLAAPQARTETTAPHSVSARTGPMSPGGAAGSMTPT